MIKIESWKRYWCPRGGNMNLSYSGFLPDPDSDFEKYFNPDIKPLEELLSIPCLVLLGEPGIGKSTVLSDYQNASHGEGKNAEQAKLWLDLRSVGSEQRLINKLFESIGFQSWLKGKYPLHIFLDSLDECLLRIDTVAALLADELRPYPIERLFFRIVCRTADWPLSLEQNLKCLWGKENIGVYELAPLRRIDIVSAAETYGIDPEAFINAVRQVEATPLVLKPATLSFLLNTYKNKQGLPSSQTELYSQGCELLCDEINQNRRDSGRIGKLSAKQKLPIAARIAAFTVFSNRFAVWVGIDTGDVPEEDIVLNRLSGGSETYENLTFEVNDVCLRETLGTGLFSSRGPNRLGWAHQTYAEYLAAWYLIHSGLRLSQILSLIKHSGDGEEKIVPQLSQTTAWIASMNQDVFAEVMKTDPEVLLGSDMLSTNIQLKPALVGALLRSFEEERLLDRDWEISKRYKKLNYLGLDAQLRPYICDQSKKVIVRRVAIDIAEDCRQLELTEDLLRIALDQGEEYSVRVQAVCAVSRIGDDASKRKLLPLAKGEGGEDPDDELKGYSLHALWPGLLSTKEIFALLDKPKRENFVGSYGRFFYTDLACSIPANEIVWALKWVDGLSERYALGVHIQNSMDAIMFRAWELLPDFQVLWPFAQTVISRLEKYDEIAEEHNDIRFHDLLVKETEKRRSLIQAMLTLLDEKDIALLLYPGHLIFQEDTLWFLENLKGDECEAVQQKWIQLIDSAFDTSAPVQVEAIFEKMQENTILNNRFQTMFETITLDSSQANELREKYLLRLKNQQARKKPLLQPTPSERIHVHLDRLESGELAAWWQLNREMTLKLDSTHYGNGLESDLTVLPGWPRENPVIQQRILAGAKKYILEADPETSKWLGTNKLFHPAFAGYRALILIWQFRSGFLEKISPEVWARWAPIILAYPTSSGKDDDGIHTGLIKKAFETAPNETIKTLLVLIDQENKESNNIFITRKMRECWGHELLENALFSKLKDPNLKDKAFTCLLDELLQHNVEEARIYAEALLQGDDAQLAIIAAASLIIHIGEACWDIVWSSIIQDSDFGKMVIYQVLESHHEGMTVIQRLNEKKLSALYIWLENHFPHAEDPNFDNETMAHFVGSRESVAEWRDNILRILETRGTKEACSAIAEIQNKIPHLDWLKWYLLEAQNNTRRKTWVPVKPEELLKLTKNKQVRFVQNGEQLLECILESLTALEVKLQGETPAAIELWNYVNGKYTPKDENMFSDYVKRYLDENLKNRGIVVNREVEIRRNQGGAPGERTDIMVDAVVAGEDGVPANILSVIIEVKGCWHLELLTAMQTQLVDRYLYENQCQFGLYLVGWFNCGQWDESDYRLKVAKKHKKTDLDSYLAKQAQALSGQGGIVRTKILKASLR